MLIGGCHPGDCHYVEGNYKARKGIEVGSLSLHPQGIPHGPHPGRYEGSIGMTHTNELAVMMDIKGPEIRTGARKEPTQLAIDQGIGMGVGGAEFFAHPWEMGIRKAKEFLFTGARWSAQQAREAGFVNRVVPTADLDAETLALAQRIAQAPPFALRVLKKSLNRSVDVRGLREALSAHFDLHQLSHVSEEYRQTKEAGLASAIAKGARA